eukprot:13496080-Alexandrium_andersonii.AAC.1
MPLPERRLAGNPDLVKTLLECFGQSRVFTHIPEVLGLQGHPWLQGLPKTAWKYVVVLHAIVYRCDLPSMFDSLHEDGAKHKRERAREESRAAGMRDREPAGDLQSQVRKHALGQHFKEVCDSSVVYSLPAEACTVQNPGAFLGEPAARRQRVAVDPDLQLDIHSDPEPRPPDARVYFRVLSFSVGDKRLMRIALGAGRRPTKRHVAVTVHNAFPQD